MEIKRVSKFLLPCARQERRSFGSKSAQGLKRPPLPPPPYRALVPTPPVPYSVLDLFAFKCVYARRSETAAEVKPFVCLAGDRDQARRWSGGESEEVFACETGRGQFWDPTSGEYTRDVLNKPKRCCCYYLFYFTFVCTFSNTGNRKQNNIDVAFCLFSSLCLSFSFFFFFFLSPSKRRRHLFLVQTTITDMKRQTSNGMHIKTFFFSFCCRLNYSKSSFENRTRDRHKISTQKHNKVLFFFHIK